MIHYTFLKYYFAFYQSNRLQVDIKLCDHVFQVKRIILCFVDFVIKVKSILFLQYEVSERDSLLDRWVTGQIFTKKLCVLHEKKFVKYYNELIIDEILVLGIRYYK